MAAALQVFHRIAPYKEGGICMRRRSIARIIVLSIITCGIYYLVAWVQIFSDINYAARENDTAITDLLLSIVTCGIWGIYCFWKYSKKLYDMGAEDNSLINVLLSVLGFPIISLCIMQSSINNLIDRSY